MSSGSRAIAAFASAFAILWSTHTFAAEKIVLKSLEVEKNLKKAVRYQVVLPIEIEGNPRIVNACFLWSGEGPYCFKTTFDKNNSTLSAYLTTRNPNSYKLEGFVQYMVEGKIYESNRKSKKINVK